MSRPANQNPTLYDNQPPSTKRPRGTDQHHLAAKHRLAVVIPVFNDATALAVTLQHLQAWRLTGVRVLVVDGASDDTSLEVARAGADEVLMLPFDQRGRASQMNAGAAYVAEHWADEADWLLFLHADTLVSQDALRALCDRFSKAAGEMLCWGFFQVDIVGNHWLLPLIAKGINLRSRLTGIATGDQGLWFRRDFFELLGRFPKQPLMEDVQLCKNIRLQRSGLRPAVISARLQTAGRRWLANGPFKTVLMMWWLRWRYWRGESAAEIAERYARLKAGQDSVVITSR